MFTKLLSAIPVLLTLMTQTTYSDADPTTANAHDIVLTLSTSATVCASTSDVRLSILEHNRGSKPIYLYNVDTSRLIDISVKDIEGREIESSQQRPERVIAGSQFAKNSFPTLKPNSDKVLSDDEGNTHRLVDWGFSLQPGTYSIQAFFQPESVSSNIVTITIGGP